MNKIGVPGTGNDVEARGAKEMRGIVTVAEPDVRSSRRKPKIFKNRLGQVRSGWKIALMLVLFMYLVLVPALLLSFVHDTLTIYNVLSMVRTLCEIGIALFMVYVIECRPLREFGLPFPGRFVREILYGVALGVASMIAIFAVLLMTGNVQLKYSLGSPQWSAELLFMLILMVSVGFGEEMMFRGYIFTVIQRQTGKRWLAVVVSSVLFAAAHLANLDISAFALVNLTLFGVLQAFMYIRSRSLWLPIAFHATWDYFEGNVFGFPDSGNAQPSLFPLSHMQWNFLTGGGFGPEGGILVTVVVLIALYWVCAIYKPRFETE